MSKSLRYFSLPVMLALALTRADLVFAAAEQSLIINAADQPLTIKVSGLMVPRDALRFGAPPSHSWQSSIVELATEGARVNTGDMLVRFDASKLDDRARKLTGELAIKQGELGELVERQAKDIEDEKVAFAAATSMAQKAARKTSQPENLIARMDYKILVEEKRIANVLLEQAQQRKPLSEALRQAQRAELETAIKQIESQLKVAQTRLATFTITAPRSGLVIIGLDQRGGKLDVNMPAYPGLVVVELVDDSRLDISAEIPEQLAASLATGQPVKIVGDGGLEVAGVVGSVSQTVRRQSRGSLAMVRDVSIRPTSDDNSLRLGTSVQLIIQTAKWSDAIAIPSAAVSYRDGLPGVRLANGKWKHVQLGVRSEDQFIVLSGLEDGQEIKW